MSKSRSNSAARADIAASLDRQGAGAAPLVHDALTDLLGAARAAIVGHLRLAPQATTTDLAQLLGVSSTAVRRHLHVLEDGGLIEPAEVAPEGRGRPSQGWILTVRGQQLYPARTAELARDLVSFVSQEAPQLWARFLQARDEQRQSELTDALASDTGDDLVDRVRTLASALSDAGYSATVSQDGDDVVLTQHHCALADVTADHPEICAREEATFTAVLGEDVELSRELTIAGGAASCVCVVRPKGQ